MDYDKYSAIFFFYFLKEGWQQENSCNILLGTWYFVIKKNMEKKLALALGFSSGSSSTSLPSTLTLAIGREFAIRFFLASCSMIFKCLLKCKFDFFSS